MTSEGDAFDDAAATFIPEGQLDGVYEFTYEAPGACSSAMVTVTLSSTVSTMDLAAHLVSYWDFDENTDDHRSGNHGTIVGSGFTYEDGIHGKGIDLDGVDTYVNVSHDPSLDFTNQSLSVSAWFRVDEFDKAWQTLISKGEGNNFRIARFRETDSISYSGGLFARAAPIDINDNQFHHVVAVTSAGQSRSIYIDGQLALQVPIGSDISDTGMDLFIGNNPDEPGRSWNGMVDDMAIWDKALDACEVGFIYEGAESIREKLLPCTDRSFYVNASASPGGDGLTWAAAFDNLQDALDLACFCADGQNVPEIHVMEGTYYPSREFDTDGSGGSDPREVTFYINKNLKLYGGYYPISNSVLRNWKTHPTILSGDIGDTGDPSDNSSRVMIIDGENSIADIDSTCVIDGFTIQNGNANTFANSGGGIYMNGEGFATIVNPVIRNCTFKDNNASASGGALYFSANRGEVSPWLENCSFINNKSNFQGGAIWSLGFSGGMSNPKIISCTFSNNTSSEGGAIQLLAQRGVVKPLIINSIFSNNQAPDGSVIWVESQAGFNIDATCSPVITNCTFANNGDDAQEATIHFNSSSFDNSGKSTIDAQIHNSIFWNNGQEIIVDPIDPSDMESVADVTIINSLLEDAAQDGDIDAIAGTTFMGVNLDAYPMFQDSMNGDFSLMTGSPAIDAGDNSLVQSVYDITGSTPRIMNQVDMGAYEFGDPCDQLLRFYLPGVFDNVSRFESTDQDIEISSGILNQSDILFNMRTGMTMLKEFEVEAGSKMEVILVGCSGI